MGIQDVFANNVRRYRKAKGLTQEELAEKSELHRTYIGGIEQRRINVSLKNVGKIAEALEIDPAFLFMHEKALHGHGASAPSASAAPAASAMLTTPATSAVPASSAAQNDDLSAITAAACLEGTLYTLCSWTEEGVTLTPLDVQDEDAAVHILCTLIREGYEGDELVREFNRAQAIVISYFDKTYRGK